MENGKKLKILMLEDSWEDAGLIERALNKNGVSFVTERVDSREEFTSSIQTFQPDVVLSDHGLPQFNSIEALKICLKERSLAPFILVTGTVSEEFAITCLNLGADDYILKSNLSRLPSAIHRALKARKLESLKREARRALRKQNEELFKVNQELDSLVYSASHNLRAPLTSVMGLLHLARNVDKDKRLEDLHMMMQSSISHLDETLKEIVEYSRNARSLVEITEINLTELIKETVDKLGYQNNNSALNFNIRFEDETLFRSDKNRLWVIFNNLLSNAFQYSEKSKASIININATINRDRAVITFEDNGIGIREECLPKVFNMFYRGTEKSQGAGLGLYIVKETLKRLNGNIELSSVFNQGTKVIITIPNGLHTEQE